MSPLAQETASMQTLGFFERLVEASGGKDVQADFTDRVWLGEPKTLAEIFWR